MPEFRYRAVSPTGIVLDGQMTASNKAEVVASLQQSGHVPIRAEEVRGALIGSVNAIRLIERRTMKTPHLVLFTRQMATLLTAGLPLDRALQIVSGIITEPAERQRIDDLLQKIEGGKSLADAMAAQARGFPAYYVGMVRAGEAGASLDSVLERLADFIERAEESRQRIRSALLYPAIVCIACVISLGILFGAVIPQFKPLFEEAGGSVPMTTRVVLAVSDAIQAGWWMAPLILVPVVLFTIWQIRRPAIRARWDHWILKTPLFGDLVRKIETARFCRTLGTLLRNGVPIVSSMEITRQAVGNRFLADAALGAIESVKEGSGLSDRSHQRGRRDGKTGGNAAESRRYL
jgi:general secretion pathway protein F